MKVKVKDKSLEKCHLSENTIIKAVMFALLGSSGTIALIGSRKR